MRLPARLPFYLSLAVLLLVAAVTLLRGSAALGGNLLTAGDERWLYHWAAGDPAVEARLAAVAPQLPPDAGVRLIVPAGTHPGWATFHGLYHLPQQRLLGVHRPADGPPPGDAWIVDLTLPEPRVIPPRQPAESSREGDPGTG